VKKGTTIQAAAVLGLGLGMAAGSAKAAVEFTQANLVSDGFVPAAHLDLKLVNPWGISFNPSGTGSPFWVSDNNAGVATVYTGAGVSVMPPSPVSIAPPNGGTPGTATPTGTVFNIAGSGFNVTNGVTSGSSKFLFATEDGTISGWSPTVDASHSILAKDNSGSGAVYKGLAIADVGGGNTNIYVSNFHSGQVEVYDQGFGLVKTFTDPTVPAGYAPFNVQVLNGKLYVTFALQDADKHDDVKGPGHGFVDTFNLDGTGMQRIASNGRLNSPWGLTIAPASMGPLAGDLLVGNFGNGTISVFDKVTNAFLGDLKDLTGHVIQIGDLWAIIAGDLNPGGGSDPNALYFTAGVIDEMHGLFGTLTPSIVAGVPEPTSLGLIASGLVSLGWWRRRRNGRTNPA